MDELNFFKSFWKFQAHKTIRNLDIARNPLAWYDSDFRYLAEQVEEDYEVFINKISEEVWNSQKSRD
jgi:hypothetical protein